MNAKTHVWKFYINKGSIIDPINLNEGSCH